MAHDRSLIDSSRSFRLRSSLVSGLTLAVVVAFCEAFYGLRVYGRGNLDRSRAFLVSNHSLCLDPAIVAAAIRPRRAFFTALERTFSVPALGRLIRLLGAVPVPRCRPLEGLRAPIRRAMAAGRPVHFFPEGRLRRRRRDVGGFRDGVFLLSVLSGIPVIPVVVLARPRLLLGRPARCLPPRIEVVVAPAVDPDDSGGPGARPRERARSMSRRVRALMRAILAAGPFTAA